MNHRLLGKGIAIGLLSLLLLIPLAFVEGLITERNARRIAVEAEVAEGTAGPQHLIGPLLLLTYQEQVVQDVQEANGKTVKRLEQRERHRIVPPREIVVEGSVKVEPRRRGLYKAQVYRAMGRVSGRFVLPKHPEAPASEGTLTPGPAYLIFSAGDRRGLQGGTRLEVLGHPREFQVGSHAKLLPAGLEVPLGPLDPRVDHDIPFDLNLDLLGSRELSIAPVGGTTRIDLKGDWGNPSFQGRFLPLERRTGPQGFEARWQVHQLARDLDAILADKGDRPERCTVAFIEPLNVYLETERAVKYGVLFVLLTLGAFFLYEVLRRLPIHPVQYSLVGLALGTFFLLLLSLAERVPFPVAYGLAAGACVLVLSGYLAGVLRSRRDGLFFGAGLALLFAALYALLASEDNALLLGALLLFTLLAGVMFGTRSVDWYRVGSGASPALPDQAPR